MIDYSNKITYKGREYTLVFNLNVMEQIQKEYGSLDKWGGLTDGKNGEPDARAVIFGITEMINEGIDIGNDENGTNEPFLTHKQVGRMITDIGLRDATEVLQDTVVQSTQSTEKNA
ncbi:MAG: hypothetical protein IJI45_18350 [Anaerolineaceae bacterium]|nr:hypothetical protein [Anaerolineaceae bacterium]